MKLSIIFLALLAAANIAVAEDVTLIVNLNSNESFEYDVEEIEFLDFNTDNYFFLLTVHQKGRLPRSHNFAEITRIGFGDELGKSVMFVEGENGEEKYYLRNVDSLVFKDLAHRDFCTVEIGTQIWMCKNLDVKYYRNGDPIRHCPTDADWKDAAQKHQGAWCYYDHKLENGEVYGALYNWHAVNDPRGLAPEGWKIPTTDDWYLLDSYFGGSAFSGGKLKEAGTEHWYTPNRSATNESGFTALPGGSVEMDWGVDPVFADIGFWGFWWSADQDRYENYLADQFHLDYYSPYFVKHHYYKEGGLSVRCLYDYELKVPHLKSVDPISAKVGEEVTIFGLTLGKERGDREIMFGEVAAEVYPEWTDGMVVVEVPEGAETCEIKMSYDGKLSNGLNFSPTPDDLPDDQVVIGYQIWMKRNLDVDTFANGDPIKECKTEEEWEAAKENHTPVWCYYNFDPELGKIYGKLYNGYCLNDERGLAPEGWIIPNRDDIVDLVDYLGGEDIAGGKLKEAGTEHWLSPNTGGTNSTRFTALPGGNKVKNFQAIGRSGYWWTGDGGSNKSYWYLNHKQKYVWANSASPKSAHAVRCMKRLSRPLPTIKRIDPNEVTPPNEVTVYGKHFGKEVWNVYFNDEEGAVLKWTDTEIRAKVPIGISGEVDVKVKNKIGESNEVKLDVLEDMSIVKIGDQIWQRKNLDVKEYRNGDPIKFCETKEDWDEALTNEEGACCCYDFDPAKGEIFGLLYNGYAIEDERNIAPKGWKLPESDDWRNLKNFLGGAPVAGGKLKEAGTERWIEPNTGATNESGFTALPAGKFSNGQFKELGEATYYYHELRLRFDSETTGVFQPLNSGGYSVRCVMED